MRPQLLSASSLGSFRRASAAIASLTDKGACFMSLSAAARWLLAVSTPSPAETVFFEVWAAFKKLHGRV